MIQDAEMTLQEKLGLLEDATKLDIQYALNEHNRKLRAFSLRLPLASPWWNISHKYILLRKRGIKFWGKATVLKDDSIRHPISQATVQGRLLERDLEPIKKGDLCACYNGTWRLCHNDTLLYRTCSSTTWVRP